MHDVELTAQRKLGGLFAFRDYNLTTTILPFRSTAKSDRAFWLGAPLEHETFDAAASRLTPNDFSESLVMYEADNVVDTGDAV